MRTLSLVVLGCVLLPVSVAAQKVDLKKQLLGKWEATLKDSANMDFKVVTEFKDDGKHDISIKGVKAAGTWKVVDDTHIETETKFEESVKKARYEVKVTRDALELKDPDGQSFKFKRAK